MDTIENVINLVSKSYVGGVRNEKCVSNAIDLLRHMISGCVYHFGNTFIALHVRKSVYVVYTKFENYDVVIEFEYLGDFKLKIKKKYISNMHCNIQGLMASILGRMCDIIMIFAFMNKKMEIVEDDEMFFSSDNVIEFLRKMLEFYGANDECDYFKTIIPRPQYVFIGVY